MFALDDYSTFHLEEMTIKNKEENDKRVRERERKRENPSRMNHVDSENDNIIYAFARGSVTRKKLILHVVPRSTNCKKNIFHNDSTLLTALAADISWHYKQSNPN